MIYHKDNTKKGVDNQRLFLCGPDGTNTYYFSLYSI